MSWFESKSKKAKIAKGKAKETKVSINVGFTKLDKTGNFKKCRGKTLPIKVLPLADKESILAKSVRKHSNHDKAIHKGLEYMLLFPDGNEVVKLRGTDKDFSLKEYREDVGRNYNRVTLFIATRSDFLFSEIPNCDNDSDFDQDKRLLDSDLDYSIYETRRTDSRGRGKMGAGSSSEVEVEVPDTRSSVNPIKVHGQSTPQMHGSMMDVVKELRQIECPTCEQLFPVTEIADHADANVTFGLVKLLPLIQFLCLVLRWSCHKITRNSKELTEILLCRISNLAESLSENPVRLNVRRRHMWSDVKEARLKQRVNPGNRIKIVYIGEPAVDDGGPRREFFSGMTGITSYINVAIILE